MKTFWLKYRVLIISALVVILLFVSTSVYYRHQVSVLKKELHDTKVKHVLEIDSLKTGMIHEQIRLTDSILSVEREKYEALQLQLNQTKKEYEKISFDYSDIVIDRPDF